jgi:hypothetical protein
MTSLSPRAAKGIAEYNAGKVGKKVGQMEKVLEK